MGDRRRTDARRHAVLFEGTPDYPNPDRLWEIVERHRVTILGIAPTAIRALMPQGRRLAGASTICRRCGCSARPARPGTRIPGAGTSRRSAEGSCPIINYSGGTETGGGIVGCDHHLRRSSPAAFTGPVAGMDADVVDDAGNPVRGAVGELVVRQPWVGMTRGFWRDPERYVDTYWSRFPGTVGAWRLGRDRRGRVLVHPRPLRRHAQGRGQADRAGRGRIRRCRARRRAGGSGDRRAARVKGEAVVVLCVLQARSATRRRSGRRGPADDRSPARLRAPAGMRPLRARAAEDPERQDHAPGYPGGVSRASAGRH